MDEARTYLAEMAIEMKTARPHGVGDSTRDRKNERKTEREKKVESATLPRLIRKERRNKRNFPPSLAVMVVYPSGSQTGKERSMDPKTGWVRRPMDAYYPKRVNGSRTCAPWQDGSLLLIAI